MGKLFLIPSYLDNSNDGSFIAPMVKDVVLNTQHFIVENIRTARRFISSLQLDIDIPSLHFNTLDKKTTPQDINEIMLPLQAHDVGLISEAGLPCLADPGNLAVSWAHKYNYTVEPLPGASSIQMALIASGFNGQCFTFHGYLPIDKKEQIKKIRQMEKEVAQSGYTQIFMETPFRNNNLIKNLLSTCADTTLLTIASAISAPQAYISTKSIGDWKKEIPELHKIPTVFCVGTFAQ